MKAVAVICVGVIGLLACRKDHHSKSKKELLTTGSWHVTAYTIDPALDYNSDGTAETDIYAIMDACIKDDHTTFFANGTAELDEGATKCQPYDAQTTSLTWSIDKEETRLEVQGIEYLIQSITETQMILKEIQVISDITYTHTVTFSQS